MCKKIRREREYKVYIFIYSIRITRNYEISTCICFQMFNLASCLIEYACTLIFLPQLMLQGQICDKIQSLEFYLKYQRRFALQEKGLCFPVFFRSKFAFTILLHFSCTSLPFSSGALLVSEITD